MAIEGTGIKTPSKQASKKATAFLGGFQRKADEKFIKTYERKQEGGIQNSDFETDRYNKLKQKYGDQFSSDAKSNFFSPGGGAFDERNEVKVATAGDFSGTFNESDFQGYMKALDIKRPKALPPTMIRMLRENYQDDVRDGRYKEGQLINQATVKEKPSFVEQTKNLAGSIFNTVTGTQPAAASQIPGGMPTGTQFTSSNLDAARASTGSVDTGDTSFSSFRMAGQPSVQEEKKNIVTPFSQTSMGRGESVKVTPFSQTSMAKDKPTVTAPTVSPRTTTPKTLAERQASKTYEQNRLKEGEKFADRGKREAVNASGFQQANVRGSTSFGGTGKDESKRPTVERQTVASLPSNYKQTEEKAFAEAAAFKARQAKAKAASEAKAKKAAESKRAAAAAAKAKAEGKTKAQQAAAARKAAGPNRTMSAGQQTRAQAGASARTAQGNRARVKSNARKRAQAAARKRRKNRGRNKRCDIFLKYNISPLTNMNLIRDDLAEVAYFVKEIQK